MVLIFISHASEDKKFARKLKKDLDDLGYETWIDEREINVGDSLPSKLQKGITNCDFLVLILSHNSVESKWVNIEWEAAFQREIDENKKIILPVLIEKCEIPLFLKRILYVDFTNNYTEALLKLAKVIVNPDNEDKEEIIDPKPEKQKFAVGFTPSFFGRKYEKF